VDSPSLEILKTHPSLWCLEGGLDIVEEVEKGVLEMQVYMLEYNFQELNVLTSGATALRKSRVINRS